MAAAFAMDDGTRRIEEHFRAFLAATGDVVYSMSPDWAVMRHLEGRSLIEDTTEPSPVWLDRYIPTDDQPRMIAAIHEAIEKKGVFELEHRIIRADGAPGWVFSRAVPILDTNGQIAEWVGAARDVTDRRQERDKLAHLIHTSERERRLYQTILSNTPDFVYVFDLNHRFIYANHALLTMWGRTWDEAIGKTCLELGYEPWHAEMHDHEIEQVIATRQAIRGEVPFTGTYGRRIYDYIFVPVLGASGEVEAIAGTTRDVTERKHSEDALREAADHDQAARLQAEATSRMKDEFLAVVSHELRTPLTSILGWSNILQFGAAGPERSRKAVQTIERNARTLTQIIDDLLDVSRIISGKLRLDIKRLNPLLLAQSAVETLRPAAAAKGVDLRPVVSASNLGIISGDADRLQQILWNLVSNAIKFTPREGLVEVQLERSDSQVEITVRDSGSGIKPEFLPFVFDRFRQSDASTTRSHGGLGLGLAIVRHLVELHGGTVHAESPGDGKGAIFTVRLPAAAACESRGRDRSPAAGEALKAIEYPERLDGIKVLIVDDETDSAEVLKMMLSQCGAQVTAAGSAGDALNAIQDNSFDLIVSDIGMPEMDGYELMKAVREQGKTTPAVALTAYARAEDRLRALRAGYQMHVTKPVEYAELITVLSSLLHRDSKAS